MRTIPKNWPVSIIDSRKNKIDPKPPYQRAPVWSEERKQFLIDTLLREYDIPKIYLRKIANSPFEHEVADGQQRLRAIWDFMAGNFSLGEHSDDIPGFGDLTGTSYSNLPSDLRDKLLLYELSIVILEDASDEEIRDIFLRLQEGAPLNPAEKRNAMIGNMRNFVASIADEARVFPLTSIKQARFAWHDLAAHIVCLELAHGPTNLKAPELKQMYATQARFELNGNDAKNVKRHLKFMERVLQSQPPEMDIKWGFCDLYLLISSLDHEYILKDRESDFASFYISFECDRRDVTSDPSVLLEKGRSLSDKDMYNYIIAFVKDGGKRENIQRRHDVYSRAMHTAFPDLVPKDSKRDFTRDQRTVIWRRDLELCKSCGNQIGFDAMHADHIIPHSRGGQTTVENGQTLCAPCNLKKGATVTRVGKA